MRNKRAGTVSKTEKMKLDPTTAKRIEDRPAKNKDGRSYYRVFIFDCICGCGREIKCSYGQLYTATGKCSVCASRTRPYQHIFGYLKATARNKNLKVDLTYENLVDLTKIKECHYCGEHIHWLEWSSGKNYNKSYHLDRKDNTKGYSLDNVVVCCTECNFLRQNKLSYEEFLLLSPGLREIKRLRREEENA